MNDPIPPQPEPLHELTLGQARAGGGTGKPLRDPARRRPTDDGPPEGLETRCRTRAEAARRVADRQRDPSSQRTDTAADAWEESLTNAYYWLDPSSTAAQPGPAYLDDVAGQFSALAEACELLRRPAAQGGAFARALTLFVEAQSGLRRSLSRLGIADDPDQIAAFEWARESAARRRIFVKRYLRADDLADPSAWPDLRQRIAIEAGEDPASREQRRLLDELRAQLGDWPATFATIEALQSAGLPPSDRALREILRPILDGLPELDELPASVRRVLRAIEDAQLAQEEHAAAASETPAAPSPEVVAARGKLRGRSIVLIGGLRRPSAQHALETALGLDRLIWIETKEHESIEHFAPEVARAEVALVLLAIRWSSHAFGEVVHLCEAHGKPLVRLPGGYNPNQVAAQILAQCGERLTADPIDGPADD